LYQFAPASGKAPPARLNWEFRDSLHDSKALTLTVEQVRLQLEQAGYNLMSVGELSGGWIIIDAQKNE